MKLIKWIFRKLILSIGNIVYEPKYLRSYYFEETSYGLKWIIRGIVSQKILKKNSHVPWPVSGDITINGSAANIIFDPINIDNFQGKGIYYQCESAMIKIGKGTLIANNVGFITANHDINNIKQHQKGEDIVIGENCWIGINSVILPGIILGDNTIVGAGSIVTKPFVDGNCIIAGNPAKLIRTTREQVNNEVES